jgi:glutamate carboxypeptidase
MNLDTQKWIAGQQDDLLKKVLELSAINSGTGNLAGLALIRDEFEALFSPLSDEQQTLQSTPTERVNFLGETLTEQYGDILSFSKRPAAPVQVLLVGHMDTVFPKSHHFQSPVLNDGVINGPGTADMKGGILTMLTALRAFENSQTDNNMGWRVILNADEETGSHGSASLLASAAKKAHVGMIYEPALPDGTLAGARKGSGNFTFVASGLGAHAGREFSKGRNAILLLTEVAQTLAELTDIAQGITVNVARISGGTVFNVVPDQAVCQFNIRCESREDQIALTAKLEEIEAEFNGREGFGLKLSGTFSRPPKVISPANDLLMSWTQECGQALNLDLRFKATGGCCDGNNLAAAGLPNIDTLGVLGDHIHTDKEYMVVNSLTERANLSYLLLNKISNCSEDLLKLKERSN